VVCFADFFPVPLVVWVNHEFYIKGNEAMGAGLKDHLWANRIAESSAFVSYLQSGSCAVVLHLDKDASVFLG